MVRFISKKSRFRGPLDSNMVNGPKHSWNLNGKSLPHLVIIFKVIELEKVSFSDMKNPNTVSI